MMDEITLRRRVEHYWRLVDGADRGVLAHLVHTEMAAEAAQAERAAFEAKMAAHRHAMLLLDIKSLELRLTRLARKAGFNPDQPRDEFGKWTPAGGGGVSTDGGLLGGLLGTFGEAPDGTPVDEAGVLNDQPLDLTTEEGGLHGGHAINRHVGRSDDELIGRLLATRRTDFDSGRYVVTSQDNGIGSFDNLSEANRFVRETVSLHAYEIEAALAAKETYLIIEHRFGYRTGREAYSDTHASRPYIRDTYAVRVVLYLDRVTGQDYRVRTAFPIHHPYRR